MKDINKLMNEGRQKRERWMLKGDRAKYSCGDKLKGCSPGGGHGVHLNWNTEYCWVQRGQIQYRTGVRNETHTKGLLKYLYTEKSPKSLHVISPQMEILILKKIENLTIKHLAVYMQLLIFVLFLLIITSIYKNTILFHFL